MHGCICARAQCACSSTAPKGIFVCWQQRMLDTRMLLCSHPRMTRRVKDSTRGEKAFSTCQCGRRNFLVCAFSEATQRGSLFDSLVFSRRQYLHAIVMFPKYEVSAEHCSSTNVSFPADTGLEGGGCYRGRGALEARESGVYSRRRPKSARYHPQVPLL